MGNTSQPHTWTQIEHTNSGALRAISTRLVMLSALCCADVRLIPTAQFARCVTYLNQYCCFIMFIIQRWCPAGCCVVSDIHLCFYWKPLNTNTYISTTLYITGPLFSQRINRALNVFFLIMYIVYQSVCV